jgi:hypothetical protein
MITLTRSLKLSVLPAILVGALLPVRAQDDFNGLTASQPAGKSKPAPRDAAGHPDLTGFWKGDRATKPVGNIGKDLPGFKLPLTAAGAAA